MIDVGEAKVGDIVELNGKAGRVLKVESHRTIDDECEFLTVNWGRKISQFSIPEPTANLIKSNEKKIKSDAYYKFNSKEDYIDFLETAEKDGLRWFGGQKPTDKDCISYYSSNPIGFYIHTNCEGLEYGHNYEYDDAYLWAKETTKGITATIIAHDEGIDYDKAIVTNIIKTFDRLKKEGDFKEMKIIINEPAVVLIKNGKKYVSKAHNEEFDAEKGLLMCLAKSNGISHLDLKRMLKSAAVQNKKVKKEKTENQVKVAVEKIETKTVEENEVVSPKGRHRGKPFYFYVGDKVVVRDCDYYRNTTNAKAKALLNHIYEIQEDKSDFAGTVYVVNGVEFSGSELEPVKE